MDTTPKAWHQRPVPALLVGVALLAVCALSLVVWLTQTNYGARAVGLLTGAAGVYFTWGGINGLKER